jgi:predicted membrane channel-forming protein YqfA (hemolysin III family)
MKITNKTKVYSYTFFAFVFTFAFTRTLLAGFKTNDFDYLQLAIYLALVIMGIANVIKFSKLENNSNNEN